MADVIDKIYHDVSHPASLGGRDKLWKAARAQDKLITKQQVTDYLKTQQAYTLHKITRKKFPRRNIVAARPKIILSCDLADVSKLSRYNKGYKYLLFCIDVFSRYLMIEPLTRKTAEVTREALRKILPHYAGVTRLFVDLGTEFYNNKVKDYLKTKNITIYSVESREVKASIVERVIRTIKQKLYTYLTDNNTLKYIDKLQDIVHSYNVSVHRSLGMTPHSVHTTKDVGMIKALFHKMYKKPFLHKTKVSSSLATGTYVRISDLQKLATFRKGYNIQNTHEIFKITTVDRRQLPVVYYLEDLGGEKIKGVFYREEITPTALPSAFPIHIIRKKKVRGETRYLVSWLGYPPNFNSWISEKDIE